MSKICRLDLKPIISRRSSAANLLFHDRSFVKLVMVTTCPMRDSNPPTTGLESAVADLVGHYRLRAGEGNRTLIFCLEGSSSSH